MTMADRLCLLESHAVKMAYKIIYGCVSFRCRRDDPGYAGGLKTACRHNSSPFPSFLPGRYKVYGVSARFVQDILSIFRKEVALESGHASSSDASRPSEGRTSLISGGGGGPTSESEGKQRKRGGSRKGGMHVSAAEVLDHVSPTSRPPWRTMYLRSTSRSFVKA